MGIKKSEVARTRRRGGALEAPILAAVRKQLALHGYAGVTYDSVASAAATSKAVLYRRWRTKAALVAAALIDGNETMCFTIPDTGTLSGDIGALLRLRRDMFFRQYRNGSLGLLAEFDSAAVEAIRPLLFAKHTEWLDPILLRARNRGELGPAKPTPRALSLPFDLLRHDALIVGHLSDDGIDELVATCVMPLFVALSHAETASSESDFRNEA